MLVFGSPAFAQGSLQCALARKNTNRYILVLARAYGMAATREWAILNSTTPSSDQLVLSTDDRPCIWLDTDLDRDERNLGPQGGVLAALLAAEPPIIKETGRKKKMYASEGGERVATEVEILLREDEMARFCHYCGGLEEVSEDLRFERCGGGGYTSLYWCPTCQNQPKFTRIILTFWRKLW